MARRFAAIPLACSLAALLPALAGEPVAPLRLERLLGPDVIACVRVDTRLATWEGPVRASALGRMVAEPEVAQALAPLWRSAQAAFAPPGSAAAVTSPFPPALRWVLAGLEGLSGELSVAWMDGDVRAPRLAALLDFGPRLSHAVAFLERARERAVDGAPVVDRAASTTAGFWRVGVGGRPSVEVAVVGTALIASTDAAWLRDVVRGGLGTSGGAASLATSAAFVRLRRRTADDAAAWGYVDLALLRERLPAEAASFGGAIGDALGLRSWRAAAYGLGFDGDRVVERAALDAPRADGLLGLLAQGPGVSVGLDLAPRGTLLHAELGLEVAPLLRRVTEVLDALDADLASDLTRLHVSIWSASGVDPDREVLGRFTGREAAWLGLPPTGGLFPELAFVARVREPEAFERAFELVLAALLERWSSSGELVATARTLPGPGGARLHVIGLDRPPGTGVSPFTPTWAVVGDRLLVTLVPHAMREILARARAGDPPFRDDPAAAALRGEPGTGDDPVAGVHLDTRALLRCLYDTGAPLLQSTRGGFGLELPGGFDPALLPATRTISPFLRATRLRIRVDGDGADVSVTAPLPPLALAAVGLLLGRLAHPEAAPAPAEAESSSASVRDDPEARTLEVLERVGVALEEHRARLGAWPDRLEDLVERSRLLASVPLDGWGSPLLYGPGPRPGSVTVRSPGPDGRPDTDDDRTRVADVADR